MCMHSCASRGKASTPPTINRYQPVHHCYSRSDARSATTRHQHDDVRGPVVVIGTPDPVPDDPRSYTTYYTPSTSNEASYIAADRDVTSVGIAGFASTSAHHATKGQYPNEPYRPPQSYPTDYQHQRSQHTNDIHTTQPYYYPTHDQCPTYT